jgi:hypothetical protein
LKNLELVCDDIEYVKLELENINLRVGYVVSTNIFDSNYPIINQLAKQLLTEQE